MQIQRPNKFGTSQKFNSRPLIGALRLQRVALLSLYMTTDNWGVAHFFLIPLSTSMQGTHRFGCVKIIPCTFRYIIATCSTAGAYYGCCMVRFKRNDCTWRKRQPYAPLLFSFSLFVISFTTPRLGLGHIFVKRRINQAISPGYPTERLDIMGPRMGIKKNKPESKEKRGDFGAQIEIAFWRRPE